MKSLKNKLPIHPTAKAAGFLGNFIVIYLVISKKYHIFVLGYYYAWEDMSQVSKGFAEIDELLK